MIAHPAPEPEVTRMTPTPPRTKRAIIVCMRNEGVFVPEWVAYHRAIGFDRIFMVTNNCQDGTDLIADRLAELEPLIHIRNEVPPGMPPQTAGLRHVQDHPAMADVEWALHVDADEFLNVSIGSGMVDDLIAVAGHSDCIALAWRYMASGGRKIWDGGSLIAEQTQTHDNIAEQVAFHKSMFRPDQFRKIAGHMPKDPVKPEPRVTNSEGKKVPCKGILHPTKETYSGIKEDRFTWANADIHHYFVRSEDVFMLKNVRGDGMGYTHSNHMLGSKLWSQAERTTTTDTNIQTHLPALQARLAAYAADPVMAGLMAGAQAWLDMQRETHLTPANRKRWDIRKQLERKLAKQAAAQTNPQQVP